MSRKLAPAVLPHPCARAAREEASRNEQLIKPSAETAGVPGIAPHDLRRTFAKLCRAAGGELEQIQLLLGHASIQTTERYLGTKQDLAHPPNGAIRLQVV